MPDFPNYTVLLNPIHPFLVEQILWFGIGDIAMRLRPSHSAGAGI